MNNNYEIKIESSGKSIITNDSLNIENPKKKKIHFNIGLQVGSHSPNLNQNSSDFNRGVFFEAYLKFNLSDEVHSIIAFTYWKSKIKEINTVVVQIPSETINSKGLKLELDFSLFKMYSVSLLLGPSISFENITRATNTVFTFGTDLKLNIPLCNDRVNLLSTISYQTGAEILRFNYSFFSYLFGIEINIGN
ncbi:MAG: hypothetical protein NTX22_09400 [Ignavibacteriales bacterium]|nr:hypothetical protein [Ignavibacteriales bacterium]